jgi:hypothetical protein
MSDSITEHLIKKIYDKVYGNGVPGMDQKLDKMDRNIQALSKDNAADHALIMKRLSCQDNEIKILKISFKKHVKGGKLINRLKKAGHDANDFVTSLKKFAVNVRETIVIIAMCVALVSAIFGGKVVKEFNDYKALKAAAAHILSNP